LTACTLPALLPAAGFAYVQKTAMHYAKLYRFLLTVPGLPVHGIDQIAYQYPMDIKTIKKTAATMQATITGLSVLSIMLPPVSVE
jgi:GH25 family lysozyme M1 (1,4-beta-N-acetylmuramidase)